MSLLKKQALPHLNAGHYAAVVLSFEEKSTQPSAANPNLNPKPYVQVVLQVQNPLRPLTVNLFEVSFEIAINALSRQYNLTQTVDAEELLKHAMGNPFEITIEDTQDGYRNVHFYRKELQPTTQPAQPTLAPAAPATDVEDPEF